MQKVCYVTAFIDLDRKNWDKWEQRSVSTYLTSFSRLIKLFMDTENHEIFVYIDSYLAYQVRNICGIRKNIHIIPITEEFLERNSVLWRRLPRETDIMNSPEYKTLIAHRLDYPEHSIPKYTMINHAKIDLVVHTMSLTDASILGWVDFGYCKDEKDVPDTLLDPKKVVLGKMNFSLIKKIETKHYNIIDNLTNPAELVEGGFFFSDRDTLKKYQKLYHLIHSSFHSKGIVDDDQHIILQMHGYQPNFFNLVYQGKWLQSLHYFQLRKKPEIVVYPAGGLGNQLFQICHGYALAQKFNAKLYIINKPDHDYRQGNPPAKYEKTIFSKLKLVPNIQVKTPFILREEKWSYQDTSKVIQNALESGNHDQILIQHGFFSSEIYFKDYRENIIELFTPCEGVRNWLSSQSPSVVFRQFPELLSDIDRGYCFLGVRRTDYLQYSEHNPCSIEYFTEAMNLMNASRYYISSDDIEWCKSVFVGEKFRFFEVDDDLVQFYAGTLFSRYIISNSSYHWWISYMSECANPIVIAPDKWVGGPNCRKEDYWSIYRNGMKVIERNI